MPTINSISLKLHGTIELISGSVLSSGNMQMIKKGSPYPQEDPNLGRAIDKNIVMTKGG